MTAVQRSKVHGQELYIRKSVRLQMISGTGVLRTELLGSTWLIRTDSRSPTVAEQFPTIATPATKLCLVSALQAVGDDPINMVNITLSKLNSSRRMLEI